jgi:hypothetical protein
MGNEEFFICVILCTCQFYKQMRNERFFIYVIFFFSYACILDVLVMAIVEKSNRKMYFRCTSYGNS